MAPPRPNFTPRHPANLDRKCCNTLRCAQANQPLPFLRRCTLCGCRVRECMAEAVLMLAGTERGRDALWEAGAPEALRKG